MSSTQRHVENFSRKRSITLSPEAELQADAGESHTPKRVRQVETNTPSRSRHASLPPSRRKPQSSPHSLSRRIASRPGRVARFIEGSMRDLRSQKPPSMFLRHEATLQDAYPSIEDAMEEYMNERGDGVQARPNTSWSMRRPSTSQSSYKMQANGLAQHVNMPISDTSGSRNLDADGVNDHKEPSGIFKFGKSIAAAFRPRSWQKPKVHESYDGDAYLDLAHRSTEPAATNAPKTDALAEAKEAFEELKRSGVIKDFTKTFVRPKTAGQGSNQIDRDSGVAFNTTNQEVPPLPPNMAPAPHSEADHAATDKKTDARLSWNFRRPSLDEMRRIPSLTDIVHKRSATVDSPSLVPYTQTVFESQQTDSVKAAHDEKAEKKQSKLLKRVSKLEAQLESAKLELEAREQAKAQEEALRLAREQQKEQERAALQVRASPRRAIKAAKRMKSGFIPGALPSVPSERLLLKSSDGDDKSTWSFKCAGEADTDKVYAGPDTVPEDEEADHLAAQQLRAESMSALPGPGRAGAGNVPPRSLTRRRASRELRQSTVQKGVTSRFHPHIASLEHNKENRAPTRSMSQDLSAAAADADNSAKLASTSDAIGGFGGDGVAKRVITRTRTSGDLRSGRVDARPVSRGLPPPPPPPKDAYPGAGRRGRDFTFFEDGSSGGEDGDSGPPRDFDDFALVSTGPRVRPVQGLRRQRGDGEVAGAGAGAGGAAVLVRGGMRSASQRAEFEWPEDCF